MKAIRNYSPAIVLALVAVVSVASFPPIAHAEEASRWNVKTSLVLVDAADPFSVDKPGGGQVYAGGNAELGVSIAVEYRLTETIGLEFAALYSKSPDVNDESSAGGDELGEGPGFLPLLAGANFHLVNTDRFGIYVGPRVGWVNFGDFDLDIDGQNIAYEVDDEFAWGATAGFDYQFGDSRWSFVAEATYLDVDMNISERGSGVNTTNSFDPLIINLGAAYRF